MDLKNQAGYNQAFNIAQSILKCRFGTSRIIDLRGSINGSGIKKQSIKKRKNVQKIIFRCY